MSYLDLLDSTAPFALTVGDLLVALGCLAIGCLVCCQARKDWKWEKEQEAKRKALRESWKPGPRK